MADDYADLLAQQAALARRQKLLDALQGQGTDSTISANNGKDRLIQIIAKLGTGVMGNMSQQRLDTQGAALQKDYSGALTGELQKYMAQRQGVPSAPITNPAGPPTEEGMAPAAVGMTAGAPANPTQAAISALASRFPELQKIGQTDIATLDKSAAQGQLTPEKILGATGYTGASRVAAAKMNDPTLLVPEGEKGIVVAPGAAIKDPRTGAVLSPGGEQGPPVLGSALGMTGAAANDYYQKGPDGKVHKLDNAPKVTTNVGGSKVMIAGQKAGMEAWAKEAAKQVGEMGTLARNAQQSVQALNQLDKLNEAGTFSGPSSKPAVWLGQLAQAAGIPFDQSKLTNSQAYDSIATDAWQRIVSQYGGNRGVTASEAESIRRISPQLSNSPAARKEMGEILRGLANRQVQQYKDANSKFSKAVKEEDPSLFDLGEAILPPTPLASPVPGAPADRKPIVKGW